jgi:hypothetical protein
MEMPLLSLPIAMNLHPLSVLFLFPAMLLLLELGRRLRMRREAALESTIENTIFALFGLLLAFTFSGAATRYDTHRRLVVEEANDIRAAYLRVDLLPAPLQPELRQLFRDYATSRLDLYSGASGEISPTTIRLQQEIWRRAVAASAYPGGAEAAKLFVPAVNTMIDMPATRQGAFNMHPPPIVFLLLFTFSCGAAFLAGFSMTSFARSWFHMLALTIAVTMTIYATLEIEYPQKGLIRLSKTDDAFINLRNSMD